MKKIKIIFAVSLFFLLGVSSIFSAGTKVNPNDTYLFSRGSFQGGVLFQPHHLSKFYSIFSNKFNSYASITFLNNLGARAFETYCCSYDANNLTAIDTKDFFIYVSNSYVTLFDHKTGEYYFKQLPTSVNGIYIANNNVYFRLTNNTYWRFGMLPLGIGYKEYTQVYEDIEIKYSTWLWLPSNYYGGKRFIYKDNSYFYYDSSAKKLMYYLPSASTSTIISGGASIPLKTANTFIGYNLHTYGNRFLLSLYFNEGVSETFFQNQNGDFEFLDNKFYFWINDNYISNLENGHSLFVYTPEGEVPYKDFTKGLGNYLLLSGIYVKELNDFQIYYINRQWELYSSLINNNGDINIDLPNPEIPNTGTGTTNTGTINTGSGTINIIGNDLGGSGGWLDKSIGGIKSAVSSIASGFGGFFSALGNTLSDVGSTIYNGLSEIGWRVMDIGYTIYSSSWDIVSGLGNLTSSIGEYFSSLGTILSNSIGSIANGFGGFFSNLGSTISNAIGSIANGFGDFFSALGGKIANALSPIGNTLKSIFDFLIGGANEQKDFGEYETGINKDGFINFNSAGDGGLEIDVGNTLTPIVRVPGKNDTCNMFNKDNLTFIYNSNGSVGINFSLQQYDFFKGTPIGWLGDKLTGIVVGPLNAIVGIVGIIIPFSSETKEYCIFGKIVKIEHHKLFKNTELYQEFTFIDYLVLFATSILLLTLFGVLKPYFKEEYEPRPINITVEQKGPRVYDPKKYKSP